MKRVEGTAIQQMLWYGTGIVLMKGISFLMLPVTTRFLTPFEYGVMDVLLTWMNLASLLFGFAMMEVLYRFSRQHINPARLYQRLVQLHSWLIGGFLLLGVCVLWGCSGLLPAAIPSYFVLISLLSAAIASLLTLPICWLRLQGRADLFLYCSVGKSLVQAAICWGLLLQGFGILAVLYASILSHLLLLAWLFYQTPVPLTLPSITAEEKQFFHYAAPLLLSSLWLFLIQGAERWIVAGVLSAAELAQYAIASQFAMLVALSAEPFGLWWYPKRLAMLEGLQGPRNVAQTAFLGCALSMGAAVAIGGIGPTLIGLMLPSSYHDSALLLPALCAAMGLKQCSHILNTGCYVGQNTSSIHHINARLACIAPIVYWMSCAFAGLPGLIMTFTGIYLLRLVWFYQISQKYVPLPYPKRLLFGVIFASCLLLWITPWLSLNSAFSLALVGVITLLLTVVSYFRQARQYPQVTS